MAESKERRCPACKVALEPADCGCYYCRECGDFYSPGEIAREEVRNGD